MKLLVATCVYNDWESVKELLVLLNQAFKKAHFSADILIVDDGSTMSPPDNLLTNELQAINSLKMLPLKTNLGHQRAIAISLSYIYENIQCDAVVVMDADGEDKPSDVIRLITKLQSYPDHVIFAERTKRSEGILFTRFYDLYKILFSKLTGSQITFGNFSIIPFSILAKCVVDVNIWNHYAAAIANSKLKYKTITSSRGKRLFGKSNFNFTSLVIHGLSAMSCYNEMIAVRLLFLSLMIIGFLSIDTVIVVTVRLFTPIAVPGWATSTIFFLIIISLQLLLLCTTFIFTILGTRKNQPFIPLRDYSVFVEKIIDIYDK